MSYTPWMRSLLNRMKELYNKPNAKTIAEALPELGSGGEVSPSSVASAIHDMTLPQKAGVAIDLGTEPKKFVVTLEEVSGELIADKMISEVATAYEAGKTCVAKYDSLEFRLVSCFHENNDIEIHFTYVVCAEEEIGDVLVETIRATAADSIADSWELIEVGCAEKTKHVRMIGTTPTVEPEINTVYKSPMALTSLTITNPPATGSYSIVFASGSTATTTTIPSTILGLESFAPEANTMYEINVLDNRAVVGSWAVSST